VDVLRIPWSRQQEFYVLRLLQKYRYKEYEYDV
jgi:hypothetical protein